MTKIISTYNLKPTHQIKLILDTRIYNVFIKHNNKKFIGGIRKNVLKDYKFLFLQTLD